MNCNYCGMETDSRGIFCGNCGKTLNSSPETISQIKENPVSEVEENKNRSQLLAQHILEKRKVGEGLQASESSITSDMPKDIVDVNETANRSKLNYLVRVIGGYIIGLFLIFLFVVSSRSFLLFAFMVLLSFIIIIGYAVAGSMYGVSRLAKKL